MTDHLQNAVSAGRYLMIAGPTAAGKSGLAMALAESAGGVVINADSMQLYRDLRILTARPDAADEARVPHRLYGVLDGAERASVARWLQMAGDEVADARHKGRLPVIIGGTGMYLQAAINGIAAIPDVPQAIHDSCMQLLATQGGAAFRAMLAREDPETAARLFDGDSQRLVRAMGVVRATGRPISAWQQDPHQGAIDGQPITIAVTPPRQTVYDAIDSRFEQMMDRGAVEEVAALAARSLDPGLPVMKAIGVREIIAMQQGQMNRARAIELASRDSRHYAKRQFTWLRNNYDAQYVVDSKFSERNLAEIFAILSLNA
ncbi:MAG TPA: tRNA (adenosine(37)-N6)-dimethylallyltransferase MiaA [Alphaproteobacteria bacterium]|nr:tRNA (adenosine(37)-N6)-dimethylallyltransferase MiaA [Alphaproteobacteria bacterium]